MMRKSIMQDYNFEHNRFVNHIGGGVPLIIHEALKPQPINLKEDAYIYLTPLLAK